MREELDVLVIGGGIAGIVSAIEAARNGASVAIACAGPLFGGSSFYPGTWGLGLIGPESATDEDDLISTIEEVGCGVASHDLVETFVRGLRPSIAWLEDELGVALKRPSSTESAREATFIPCFDHKNRMWRGITREAFESTARRHIDELEIDVLERCELVELVRRSDGPHADGPTNDPREGEGGCMAGAILFDRRERTLFALPAKTVILCSGGTGGLFERSLTSRDVLSSAHGLALDAGCELVNIEFMQMMPGLVSPARGIVFNEKTFRYAKFDDRNGILPQRDDELEELLETRSGHGPFTCRLGDESVDMAIDAAGEDGIAVRYDFPRDDAPEFVQTFARWMENELGITPEDEMRISMYAHAANGGIRIDCDAQTAVPGLFVCGEATGGMHGADRIGGLSSANGLVFGRIAGKRAAARAKGAAPSGDDTPSPSMNGPQADGDGHVGPKRIRELDGALRRIKMTSVPLDDMDETRITKDMRRIMSEHAMIQRTERGLAEAIDDIERLQREARYHGDCRGCVIPTDAALARGIRVTSQLKLAHEMLTAMRKRTEGLGSHFRADHASCKN